MNKTDKHILEFISGRAMPKSCYNCIFWDRNSQHECWNDIFAIATRNYKQKYEILTYPETLPDFCCSAWQSR